MVALLCISELRPAASPVSAPKTGFVTANGADLVSRYIVERV
jgi:hypothetical protein